MALQQHFPFMIGRITGAPAQACISLWLSLACVACVETCMVARGCWCRAVSQHYHPCWGRKWQNELEQSRKSATGDSFEASRICVLLVPRISSLLLSGCLLWKCLCCEQFIPRGFVFMSNIFVISSLQSTCILFYWSFCVSSRRLSF